MQTRRAVLWLPAAVATALTASVTAACTRRTADERMAQVDTPRDSPSGEVTAVVVEDGESLRPMICDASGAELWRDDLPHTNRYFPGVLWEQDSDVLWILSADHGNGSVRQDESAAWVKTMGSDGMPEDIAQLAS